MINLFCSRVAPVECINRDVLYCAGLAGSYNHNVTDDLTGPDGVIYDLNIKPEAFTDAWR